MLNISGLKEGFVLDHIQAGRSMDIYFKLGLDKLSSKMRAAARWDARTSSRSTAALIW